MATQYRCPSCGMNTLNVSVEFTAWLEVKDGIVECKMEEIQNVKLAWHQKNDKNNIVPWWDEYSQMCCYTCGFQDRAKKFVCESNL